MTYSTETFHRVYDDDEGAFIQVGPDADSLGLVEIRTDATPENAEYFGSFRLALQPEMALALAQALVRAVEEAVRK